MGRGRHGGGGGEHQGPPPRPSYRKRDPKPPDAPPPPPQRPPDRERGRKLPPPPDVAADELPAIEAIGFGTVQTRDQRAMARALADIRALPDDQDLRDAYGRLCHAVPIWVRTNGLSQALAFIRAKGHPADAGDRAKALARAHRTIERHLAGLVGVEEGKMRESANGNPAALLDRVQQSSIGTYIGDTRAILGAWVYYKRFAVSLLRVAPNTPVDEGEGGA